MLGRYQLISNDGSKMMTFLPFPDIETSLRSLDYRRLGKQRVEAYQIWRTLKGLSHGWKNHPAVKMWRGHECYLALYHNACIDEWILRGYVNNMKHLPHCSKPCPPRWWGNKDVHMSHQASLNRKQPSHYHFKVSQEEYPAYVWPS